MTKTCGNIQKQLKFFNKYIAIELRVTMLKKTMVLYKKIYNFVLLWKRPLYYGKNYGNIPKTMEL